jgi:hypothetical protein
LYFKAGGKRPDSTGVCFRKSTRCRSGLTVFDALFSGLPDRRVDIIELQDFARIYRKEITDFLP